MSLQTFLPPGDLNSVPPIILLVEDDPDTRDMYSLFLESSGMWVATAADPATAADIVAELKPDLIVTDVGLREQETALEFMHAVKHDEPTARTPIVMLTGRPASQMPASAREDADLLLLKPVLPDDLLQHIATLVHRSRELRLRNQAARSRAAGLMQKSNDLIARSVEIQSRVDLTDRRCPTCAHPLRFVETGVMEGVEYDYYQWCARGCGLFCYDRENKRWITLAG